MEEARTLVTLSGNLVETSHYFLLSLISYTYPQVEMNYEILNYMATREADPNPNDREGIKRQFQTYFVKEVFEECI